MSVQQQIQELYDLGIRRWKSVGQRRGWGVRVTIEVLNERMEGEDGLRFTVVVGHSEDEDAVVCSSADLQAALDLAREELV